MLDSWFLAEDLCVLQWHAAVCCISTNDTHKNYRHQYRSGHYVNNACLNDLPGLSISLDAVYKPYSSKLDRLTPKIFLLKPCAPVMLTTNIDVKSSLVNGQTGIVKSMNIPGNIGVGGSSVG